MATQRYEDGPMMGDGPRLSEPELERADNQWLSLPRIACQEISDTKQMQCFDIIRDNQQNPMIEPLRSSDLAAIQKHPRLPQRIAYRSTHRTRVCPGPINATLTDHYSAPEI